MIPPAAPPGRREWIAVAALTLIGAALRLWDVSRIGLQHFDEGMYALAGLWPLDPRGLSALEMAIPYAPPGFPILVGFAYSVLGTSDLAAIAVSEVCGILTIPLAAWLGRRTFGPGAGAATAALAAISGPHVAFSRMALTDVSFLLSWLVAVGLGVRFLERPGFTRAVAFGLAVGLAQNVKYNGGLTGLIVALSAILGLLVSREGRRPAVIARTFGWGGLAAAVAGLMYLPWYGFVDSRGGYASLLAHHRNYVDGPGAWPAHWRVQVTQAVALSGGDRWTFWTCVLAWAGVGWVLSAGRLGAGAGVRRVLAFLTLAGSSLLALWVVPTLPWWAGLAWAPWLLRDARPGPRTLGAWWTVMAILTPFYHPYARLWLPLHAAGWLLLGGLAPLLWRWSLPDLAPAKDARPALFPERLGRLGLAWLGAWALLLAAVQGGPRPQPLPGLLSPTFDQRYFLPVVLTPFGDPPPAGVLHVLGRPTMRFYLALWGRMPFRTYPSLRELDSQTRSRPGDHALIDEVLLRQEDADDIRAFLAAWEDVPKRALVEGLNPPTLLDVDPDAAFGDDSARIVRWRLMRRRPLGSPR